MPEPETDTRAQPAVSSLKTPKQEPDDEGTQRPKKRKLTTSDENSSAGLPDSNSLVFTSAEKDPIGTNIIAQNLDEFGILCDEKGFQLIVHFNAQCIVVRLAQSSENCDIRAAVQAMDDLIKSKHAINTSYESRLEQISTTFNSVKSSLENKIEGFLTLQHESESQLSALKGKIDELDANQTTLLADLKAQNDRIDAMVQSDEAPFLEPFNFHIEHPELPTPEQRSIFRTTLEEIKSLSDFLDKVCNKISGTSLEFSVLSMEMQRSHLTSLLDFFQRDLSGTEIEQSEMHRVLVNTIRMVSGNLMLNYKETEEQKKMMKEKFKLTNAVGTVHILPVPVSGKSEYYLCLVIVNKKIVVSVYHKPSYTEGIIKCLYKILDKKFKPFFKYGDIKFVTKLPFGPQYCRWFVRSDVKDVFVENDNVVKWLKTNFQCLQYDLNSIHADAIPAIFNLLSILL